MCAKNHLLIFSSFLDIWENVEWPRFFLDHPVYCTADVKMNVAYIVLRLTSFGVGWLCLTRNLLFTPEVKPFEYCHHEMWMQYGLRIYTELNNLINCCRCSIKYLVIYHVVSVITIDFNVFSSCISCKIPKTVCSCICWVTSTDVVMIFTEMTLHQQTNFFVSTRTYINMSSTPLITTVTE